MIKVLLVDDDASTLTYLAKALEKYCCQVFVANSGERGIALVQKKNPDIVLLDYRMDTMNGLETLKGMRKINPDIKVNILTMEKSKEVEALALKEGARNYLHKPVNLDDLASLIIQQMHER
jgi:DNA-binding response OmpR family regulator